MSTKNHFNPVFNDANDNMDGRISNPFLSYGDLPSEHLIIPENLLPLKMWFKKLMKEKNIITTKDFKKRTSKIPHESLMLNALKRTMLIIEKDADLQLAVGFIPEFELFSIVHFIYRTGLVAGLEKLFIELDVVA